MIVGRWLEKLYHSASMKGRLDCSNTRYGVHKDGDTLAAILDKQPFTGTLVSDNAAVGQRCFEEQLNSIPDQKNKT